MPRNKRQKVVSLTQVKPKGSQHKDQLIATIREAATSYQHVIAFKVSNMRNNLFKDLRDKLKKEYDNTVIYMGKGKIMQLALGVNEEGEIRDGCHLVGKACSGGVALLFTNSDANTMLELLQSFEESNFARSGFVATSDFSLEEGVLEDQPFSMEMQLRKLGLPTKLDNGKVVLEREVVVCKKGQKLTPEQCKILEIFGVEMALMRLHVMLHLDMEAGEFQEYDEMDLTAEGDEEEAIVYDEMSD